MATTVERKATDEVLRQSSAKKKIRAFESDSLGMTVFNEKRKNGRRLKYVTSDTLTPLEMNTVESKLRARFPDQSVYVSHSRPKFDYFGVVIRFRK